ncbi:hypothetical protein BG004_005045 [Podila humilis]|nr:hypothetical protein BG004_005045 [Podila humilis]
MKFMFATIAALTVVASTASAFDCPKNPFDTVTDSCMSVMLEAARCNCYSGATVASGMCLHKCDLTSPRHLNRRCLTGCTDQAREEQRECDGKYNDYKANGGGFDWVVRSGVVNVQAC